MESGAPARWTASAPTASAPAPHRTPRALSPSQPGASSSNISPPRERNHEHEVLTSRGVEVMVDPDDVTKLPEELVAVLRDPDSARNIEPKLSLHDVLQPKPPAPPKPPTVPVGALGKQVAEIVTMTQRGTLYVPKALAPAGVNVPDGVQLVYELECAGPPPPAPPPHAPPRSHARRTQRNL